MLQYPRKTVALQMLEILQHHMSLSADQQDTYEKLQRGYLGEEKLATLFRNELHQDHLALYGVQLQVNHSECQIDCLLLLAHAMYLFEVKNFQGDYYCDNQRWFFAPTNKEIKNPLHQLKRSDLLLQEFFTQQQISFKLIPRITFVHPEFHLYQAPLNTPIIFPNQLNRFVQKLSSVPKPLNSFHQNLANQIAKHHKTESAYEQLPKYNYKQLRKGVFCIKCSGMMGIYKRGNLICDDCNQKEKTTDAIIRCILAFHLLFPKERITSEAIYYWCGNVLSQRSIQRVLTNHFTLIKAGRGSYYTLKQKIDS